MTYLIRAIENHLADKNPRILGLCELCGGAIGVADFDQAYLVAGELQHADCHLDDEQGIDVERED